MSFQLLDIQKDGLTYCIDVVTHDGDATEWLLREEQGLWYLVECTRTKPMELRVGINIGRRNFWTKALADALDLIEARMRASLS